MSKPFACVYLLTLPSGSSCEFSMDMTPEPHATQRDDLYAVVGDSEELASDLAEFCEWLFDDVSPREAAEVNALNRVPAPTIAQNPLNAL
jgi:hypothetical protein